MKGIVIFIGLVLLFVGCRQKEMSIEKLSKSSLWTKLDKGIDYISVEKNESGRWDSLHVTLMGWSEAGAIQVPEMADPGQDVANGFIHKAINEKLKDSRHGYLRVNFYESMKFDSLLVQIFLKDSYDAARLNQDIAALSKLPNVQSVYFVSKDEAIKRYSETNDEEWKKILTESPLPASFEIWIDTRVNTLPDFKKLKSDINEAIPDIGEIDIPSEMHYGTRPDDRLIYLEYKRP